MVGGGGGGYNVIFSLYDGICSNIQVKSVRSALSDLKRPPERLQSQCNYRPFIT